MEKINIIQFMPYFPPHKWWVETVWEEIWKHWIKYELWEFINIITDFEQNLSEDKSIERIIFDWCDIWYKKYWCENLVVPSLEIINNFPIYKVWSKEYRIIKLYLNQKTLNSKVNFRVITHTRFFLTSLIWWFYAKKNNIKWAHIEHGSSYVKLSSNFKTRLSFIYDKIFWKLIFKKADVLLSISQACKDFINNEFIQREVNIFYRWLDLPNDIVILEDLKKKYNNKIIIWYVWRLYKWKNVESLIKAYYSLNDKFMNNIQLVIVWDWEDFDKLKELDIDNKIYFTWWKSFNEALSYQKQFDIHIHPSSPGWWLATTLLQAMSFWCFILATPNEWAKEIIIDGKNWFLLKNDDFLEMKLWIENSILNFDKKDYFSIENKKIIDMNFNWKNNIFKLYNLVK